MLEPLSAYCVDLQTGFVPKADPLEQLPNAYDAWEKLIPDVPALIRSRRFRNAVSGLPVIDTSSLAECDRERALLIQTLFANSWMWGDAEPNLRIPPAISMPLCQTALAMGRPPIVHYGSFGLNNWRRIDRSQPVSADNVRTLVQFLGGVDEEWFFIASLGVELEGAQLLPLIHAATHASQHAGDVDLAADILVRVAAGMDPVLKALGRMREWCDPYIYYHRVRPFLAGWPAPGAIYEGVSEIPRKYSGASAAQSSLIQAIDASLGVEHTGAITGPYLREMRQYMPAPHRKFIESVETESRVRARAATGWATLRGAYNGALAQMVLFRRHHIELARDYIGRPSGMMAEGQGTGGTTFVDFLQDSRVETEQKAV